MKLSIIIPMYNAEKYIEACLDSILNSDQPKEEYEVIIVNDGSKDKGPEIAQEYCAKNENFRYLTQENQGQSVARNFGIKEANGEYIWCVDSDDKLDDSLKCLIELLKSLQGIDICAFQLKQVNEQGEFISYECSQPNVTHNKVTKGREAILQGYFPSSVCALAIRKELILKNGLAFKKGITQQDVELSYQLFAHADNVYFSELKPYIYIHHPNSTSKSTDVKKVTKYQCDTVEIIKSFLSLSQKFADSDRKLANHIRQHADSVLFGCVYGLFKNRKNWKDSGINKAVIVKLKEEGLYPLKGPFDSWKKWAMSRILNIERIIS